MWLKKITLLSLAGLFILALFPLVSRAAEPTVDIPYSQIDFGSVEAGAREEFTIPITNNNVDRTIVVEMKLEDQGNPGYKYLSLTPNPLELAPQSQGDVTLLLEIPDEARPRKYSASIVFVVKAEVAEGEGTPDTLKAGLMAGKAVEVNFQIEGYRSETIAFDAEVEIEPVRLLVYLSNFREDEDVMAHPEIEVADAGSGQIVVTLTGDTQLLKKSGGSYHWEFVGESTDYPPGKYVARVMVYVTDIEGAPVETLEDEAAFQLGFRMGELVDPGKGLTVVETRVSAGQPIVWYLILENKGTLPLNFHIQTEAEDSRGHRLLIKDEDSTIPVGEKSRFDFSVPTQSQGFPTNMKELRFVVLGTEDVTIETHISFAREDEVSRVGSVTITPPLQVRIMVFSVMFLIVGGIVMLLVILLRRRRY